MLLLLVLHLLRIRPPLLLLLVVLVVGRAGQTLDRNKASLGELCGEKNQPRLEVNLMLVPPSKKLLL